MMSRAILPCAKKFVHINGAAASRVCAYYHAPAHHHAPTMNDLPVPQGSWQADYDAKQRKNNLHLVLGISFLAGTLVVAKASGLFHFNYSVPELKDNE